MRVLLLGLLLYLFYVSLVDRSATKYEKKTIMHTETDTFGEYELFRRCQMIASYDETYDRLLL